MKRLIALDIDGVLADLISEVLNLYNNDWEDNLTPADIREWMFHKLVKPECGTKVYAYMKIPTIYNNVKPYPYAKELVLWLKNEEYRVIFITHSLPEVAGKKFKWLLKHGMIEKEDDYVEAKDKSLIHANILLDDGVHNIESFRGTGVLFRQPWNTYYNKGIIVNSRGEFYNKVSTGVIV